MPDIMNVMKVVYSQTFQGWVYERDSYCTFRMHHGGNFVKMLHHGVCTWINLSLIFLYRCVPMMHSSNNFVIFIAPTYSKVRYRGSTFRPSVRPSVRSFVRTFVRPSVHNLCQGAYSVAVIAGSMKPCIVITLDIHTSSRHLDPVPLTLISRSTDFVKILCRV